ncbi:hypothetical protein GA0116948_11677 [Chitinophaga costaii]|uniref:Uncharacterized protein n=1 Tax=Chitinophaga costaii TaxID=1335309 RepID=A0A1C4FRB8_9BACT|nr:hypothetical protein GA0116948_11677 [Chitinophaga costaii]
MECVGKATQSLIYPWVKALEHVGKANSTFNISQDKSVPTP